VAKRRDTNGFSAIAGNAPVDFGEMGTKVHVPNVTISVSSMQPESILFREYTYPGRNATMRRMLTIEQIRHRNVRKLIADIEAKSGKTGPRSGAQAEFAERISKSTTYVNQVAGERPFKAIGSAVARDIEKVFGLERGWLDNVHDGPLSQAVRLDPNMLAETAKALRERSTAEGRQFSIEADPGLFIRAYRMREDLAGTKDASNVFAVAFRFASSERGIGSDRRDDGVPAEGTDGRGMGKGRRKT